MKISTARRRAHTRAPVHDTPNLRSERQFGLAIARGWSGLGNHGNVIFISFGEFEAANRVSTRAYPADE